MEVVVEVERRGGCSGGGEEWRLWGGVLLNGGDFSLYFLGLKTATKDLQEEKEVGCFGAWECSSGECRP